MSEHAETVAQLRARMALPLSAEDRRALKVRTVRQTLAALEHETFLKLLGQPYDAAKLERLGDELVALAHVEPHLTLAEVTR